ncbi:MAG: hypothetical protein NXI00_19995, partial [Cytophagales bacterium]|nr:hypothetical protein [Cytophagales bacterium]
MALGVKYQIPFKNFANVTCRVDILVEGYSDSAIELDGDANAFEVDIAPDNGSGVYIPILENNYKITALSRSGFSLADFSSESYGSLAFKYYEDSTLIYQGVIDPFEASEEYGPEGMHMVSLSAESGLKRLAREEFRAVDDSFLEGRIQLIEAISICLQHLGIANTLPIVSEVNVDTYTGDTQVGASSDFFEKYIDAEAFKKSATEWMTCYEVLETIMGGAFSLMFANGSWRIVFPVNKLESSIYVTTYNYLGVKQSRTSTTVTAASLGDTLKGSAEGLLFSRRTLAIKQSVKSLINRVTNPTFLRSGFDILNWSNEDSFSGTQVGGDGSKDNPTYFRIDGSVYTPGLYTEDTEYIQSTAFVWNPYGTSDFADRQLTEYFAEDERARLILKGEYGTGIGGGRVQIIATFQEMGQVAPYDPHGDFSDLDDLISFSTKTLYLTDEGWSALPAFYATGNSETEEIELPTPSYRQTASIVSEDDASHLLTTYVRPTPPDYNITIRLFRPERKKIGAATTEVSGYTYYAKYFSVSSSIWIPENEAILKGLEKTFLSNASADRDGSESIEFGIYENVAPYAYGSIYETDESTDQIDGFVRLNGSTVTSWMLFVVKSFLRSSDKRLHQLTLKFLGDQEPEPIYTLGGKKYRVVSYRSNRARKLHEATLVEINYSTSSISEKISETQVSEIIGEGSYSTIKAEIRELKKGFPIEDLSNLKNNRILDDIFSFNPTGGFMNLLKEGNEATTALNWIGEDGLRTDWISPITDGFYLKAENNFGVGVKHDLLTEDRAFQYPDVSGVIATDQTAWMLGGNTTAANASIGIIDEYDLTIKTNNLAAISIDGTTQNVSVGGVDYSARFSIYRTTGGDTSEYLQKWVYNGDWALGLQQQNVAGSHIQWNLMQENSGIDSLLMSFKGGKVGFANSNPAEVIDATGNIRYSGLLKPNGTAGSDGYVLSTDGTNDEWVRLAASYLSDADSLTTNYHVKWDGSALVDSIINDASGVASVAGKLNVINNVSGDSFDLVQRWIHDNDWSLNLEQQNVSGSHLQWNFTQVNGGSSVDLMSFKLGKIGFGVTDPIFQTHIYGAGQATNSGFDTTGNKGGALYVQDSGSGAYNGGTVVFGASQGNFAAIKSMLRDGSNNTLGDIAIQTRNSNTDSVLSTRIFVQYDGKVGIGTITPSELFEVNGTGRFTNVKVTSGATDGYVAVSDVGGSIVWTDPT